MMMSHGDGHNQMDSREITFNRSSLSGFLSDLVFVYFDLEMNLTVPASPILILRSLCERHSFYKIR